MLIGQLFVEQTEINLFSSILDTPDFLWDDDEQLPAYGKIAAVDSACAQCYIWLSGQLISVIFFAVFAYRHLVAPRLQSMCEVI